MYHWKRKRSKKAFLDETVIWLMDFLFYLFSPICIDYNLESATRNLSLLKSKKFESVSKMSKKKKSGMFSKVWRVWFCFVVYFARWVCVNPKSGSSNTKKKLKNFFFDLGISPDPPPPLPRLRLCTPRKRAPNRLARGMVECVFLLLSWFHHSIHLFPFILPTKPNHINSLSPTPSPSQISRI